MRHRITQRAERDLKDIHRYTVDTFGLAQAEKYLRELDAVFQILGHYPNMGRIYEGRTHQFVHGKHIILYRVGSDEIVIGRIFHGAQRPASD
ncbi:toxin ParE1/3/4 [Hoeflea marina]|uniref:Toxin ParE1/3/4 n=1 Tax=Hoeflea marina TaxID=274592 RepID=A0A317PNA3_9HYPH|nr:type II toxin-antitoxin system RelE/ParE family toxin [Hoeflea marina]PWV99970.1 toxin ParE1/3/4 [Hoeflea marina]